ncbi:hypothetical protein JHK87_009636 [Glycine soja]|nr:hypothetical protein JHK87_009636 [Glycine soja]
MASNPHTVEEIFKDYSARRIVAIRALTHDVDKLYELYDSGKDNLCLYGHSNKVWEVTLPSEEVPANLPEPTLEINFARDDVSRKDWISLVAMHSDSWLLSLAFYFGFHLNHNESEYLKICYLGLNIMVFLLLEFFESPIRRDANIYNFYGISLSM